MSPSHANSRTDVHVIFRHQTDAAIKVDSDFAEDVWLPKAAAVDFDDLTVGEAYTITIPERLSVEKHLV